VALIRGSLGIHDMNVNKKVQANSENSVTQFDTESSTSGEIYGKSVTFAPTTRA